MTGYTAGGNYGEQDAQLAKKYEQRHFAASARRLLRHKNVLV
jgi:hypothetical protein